MTGKMAISKPSNRHGGLTSDEASLSIIHLKTVQPGDCLSIISGIRLRYDKIVILQRRETANTVALRGHML